MNKNIVIALTVVALLIIGGGVYMMNRSSTPAGTMQANQQGKVGNFNGAAGNTQGTMQTTSLKNLMASANNQQCTYNDGSGNSGTTYISNGKMRGDFEAKNQDMIITSHMISDGKDAYVWSDGEPKGFKMSLASVENVQANAQAQQQQTMDINKEFEYSCASWSVDTSVFTPPSNVEFQDMSAMMENANKMMENANQNGSMEGNSSACAACDQAPQEAQAQCKAALRCN